MNSCSQGLSIFSPLPSQSCLVHKIDENQPFVPIQKIGSTLHFRRPRPWHWPNDPWIFVCRQVITRLVTGRMFAGRLQCETQRTVATESPCPCAISATFPSVIITELITSQQQSGVLVVPVMLCPSEKLETAPLFLWPFPKCDILRKNKLESQRKQEPCSATEQKTSVPR